MPERTPGFTSRERLRAYLRGLAGRDWGAPAGFGGRTCFQAIPPLELERAGQESGVFRPEWIDYSLELLRRRQDCQDFAMVGLLRILHRYPDSRLLAPAQRRSIKEALLGAKYDEADGGPDTCCWHTENHQVQYASSEYLAGRLFPDLIFTTTGREGIWHAARAKGKLERWLDWRTRFSFSEWNSSCYYDEDAAALLNLVEYAEPDLRERAGSVLERLLLHVALNTWRGLTGGSQGRAYLRDQVAPDETPMSILAQVVWGEGPVPGRLGLGAVLLAAGEAVVPDRIRAIGRDGDELENRERHGLDAEEGDAFGVPPACDESYGYYAAAGQDHHPLVVEARWRHFGGRAKWNGFFADRDFYARCRERGEILPAGMLPHALGHADVYTFRTADYMLGCAQNFRPGTPGYQQFVWSAVLGRRAVVFTTNPAPADVPYGRPGPWVGNGVLPKVVQHRNVLVALHRVRPCPIYDQPPWFREDRVHAWFPRGAFDETVEGNGWCFGRKDGGYIGLRPLKPAAWLSPKEELSVWNDSDQPYEWEVRERDVAWVCELGSAASHGSFGAFVEALAGARVEGGVEHLVYESPSLGRVETGWERALTVAGGPVAVNDYPLFDNRFVKMEFRKGS